MPSNLRPDHPRRHLASSDENCRRKLINACRGICAFFAAVTSTLTRLLSYTSLTRFPWRYTGCANMNFLCQGSYSLTYIQTDRQQTDATEIIYHAALRVVNRSQLLTYLNVVQYDFSLSNVGTSL